MFKWICFSFAVLVSLCGLAMLNDLRVDAKGKLAEISEKTRLVAETSREVATDIRDLRALAGLSTGKERDGFVTYAHSVLSFIEAQEGAQIGIEGERDAKKASLWATGARKEALMLVASAKSREEILFRLCRTAPLPRRKEFVIRLPGHDPRSLEGWLRENHPESKSLPKAFEP